MQHYNVDLTASISVIKQRYSVIVHILL